MKSLIDMNILTIPVLTGGASHLIPLYVLHQRYFRRMGVNNYFLVDKKYHSELSEQNINVVDLDYSISVEDMKTTTASIKSKIKKIEVDAFKITKPDIIIEDCNFNTPLISEKLNIPRISIHRTGFFRSQPINHRNQNHMHSLEKGENDKKFADISFILHKKDRSILKNKKTDLDFIKNYLNSKVKLIPGIPSIEILPSNIKNRDSYFYTGPLIVEDNPSSKLKEDLEIFFSNTMNSKRVFISTGLIDNCNIDEFVNELLNKNYAVISTNKINSIPNKKVFYNPYLPLNYICNRVDLVIHHCGSGMYHYPILNEKPSITIGTQCYDREDVAIRLEQLKVSKHVPHPKDDKNYLNIFKNCITSFENRTLCDFQKLSNLKNEIHETMVNFNMDEVINYSLGLSA